MTPRERILTALSHQRPDRTPTDGWFHTEVRDSLKAHYATDEWPEVLAELGIDGWSELSPDLVPENLPKDDVPRPGHASGEAAVWIDDKTYEDVWGVRFRMGSDGRYRQFVSGPLEDVETVGDLEGHAFLTADDIRQPDDYAGQVAKLKAADRYVYANLENPFRRLWHMRGYENALADYLLNGELLESLYDRFYAVQTALALVAVRAGVDMIRIIGDIAMQDRIIVGPDLWRRFDKPRMAGLIAACRQANPDLSVFFHSDGKLTDLMDDMVEIGFSVINPIQPECMDPSEVKRRWGKHITMHGCVSIQRTLPFGSVHDVRREVQEIIDHCGRDGGLILMPSNNIQPDTPIANIQACYHAARDYPL